MFFLSWCRAARLGEVGERVDSVEVRPFAGGWSAQWPGLNQKSGLGDDGSELFQSSQIPLVGVKGCQARNFGWPVRL